MNNVSPAFAIVCPYMATKGMAQWAASNCGLSQIVQQELGAGNRLVAHEHLFDIVKEASELYGAPEGGLLGAHVQAA